MMINWIIKIYVDCFIFTVLIYMDCFIAYSYSFRIVSLINFLK